MLSAARQCGFRRAKRSLGKGREAAMKEQVEFSTTGRFVPLAPKKPAAAATEAVSIRSRRFLAGCNAFDKASVLVLEIDLRPDAITVADTAFAGRYFDRFRGLRVFESAGALEPELVASLEAGDALPVSRCVLAAILAIEGAVAFAQRLLQGGSFRRLQSTQTGDRALLAWSSRDAEFSRMAAEIGVLGVNEALRPSPRRRTTADAPAFAEQLDRLLKAARRDRPYPAGAVLLDAAERRGIPWSPMGANVIRLGHGAKQKCIWSSIISSTSRVADRLSQDKSAVNRLLTDLGLPAPEQKRVGSLNEARTAAAAIGYPVVVKPLDGHSGNGVTVGVRNAAEMKNAFKCARAFSNDVLVEQALEGTDHRLLVVNGRLIAAMKRVPPQIIGDGERSVGALVDAFNADPLRDGFRRSPVKHDEELERMLGRAGVSLETILDAGVTIPLRANANLSGGGSSIDVTDSLHPDNAAMAVTAVEAIGLDVAGVDFLTRDASRSWRGDACGIIEVNSRPGLRGHHWPIEGRSHDAAGVVMEVMFPPGERGLLPTALIAGEAGAAARVAARVEAILNDAGQGARAIAPMEDESDAAWRAWADGVGRAQRDRRVAALVTAVSLEAVEARGLLFETCAVAAVLDDDVDRLSPAAERRRRGLAILLEATEGPVVATPGVAESDRLVERVAADRLQFVSPDGGADRAFQHQGAADARALTSIEAHAAVVANALMQRLSVTAR